MAEQAGFVVESKFVNGLVTENTALNFPGDAATDTYNCVYNEFGKVSRRLGLDMEVNGSLQTITPMLGDVFEEYVWYTSAATSNKAFLCQQVGNMVYFFEITNTLTPSAGGIFTSINMNSYRPSGSTLSTSQIACQFATGNGDLLITNQNSNPIYITYNESTDNFTVTAIVLKYRDTSGLQDGLRADERPTFTVANLKTSNPNHYYNLINQGWYVGDALSQWDSDSTSLPSNADAVAYFRVDKTDPYQTGSATSVSPGNSPAPKGHFILNVGEDDRVGAAAAEGFSGFTPTGTTGSGSMISPTAGVIIGNFSNRPANAFDNDLKQKDSSSAATVGTSAYIGKNLTSISGSKVSGVLVTPSSNLGYLTSGSGPTIVIELYGKSTAPSSATDGTLLGTSSAFADTDKAKFVASSDTTTTFNYLWMRIRRSDGASDTFLIAELQFFTPGSMFVRPRCVAFYSGRAFYAGVDGTDSGANVYFSQVVVDKTKYGLCYQSNDPTSENFADLLATDGGVIKIPEMGKVQRLFPFQNSLLVFANNGLWTISGNGNDGFAATGYRVRRLSNIGMISPMSVVDIKGVPMWWAEDGIYTINYDPNYDSSAVKSLTEENIKSFVFSVPAKNRPYIRSAFDRLNNYAYFGFLSTEAVDGDDAQTFDTLLVFNAKTGAFFPWSFDHSVTNTPRFVGLEFIVDGDRQLGGSIKLSTRVKVSSTTSLTYSDFHDTIYKDYDALMALNSASEIDYSSYLVAGYRIDGQAMRNFQSKYVWTFMDDEANSSLWLRGRFDFTNNVNSGKWSTPQQVYNSLTTKGRQYDDVRISRRVVRGTGKALQLHYYSESGKPFNLIGWGIFESGVDSA